MTPSFFLRRLAHAPVLAAAVGFFLAGCQLPDLKPFATASTTLAAGITQGGDLAIAPLTQAHLKIGDELIAPGQPNHPGTQLQAEWDVRRKTAEAILVYSAALSAIGDASAKRKDNAKALVDSVRELAATVPGANVGTTAAGNLAVSLLGTFVEVKAFSDLSTAVKSADPAIQVVASSLCKDFEALSHLYAPQQRNQIAQIVPDLAAAERYYAKLKTKQKELREALPPDLSDKTKNTELISLDALLAGVESEVTAKRAELARLQAALVNGRAFFAAAISSIDTWAAAHAEIAKALQEKRTPNLTLLAARAQELRELVAALKTEKSK